MSIAKRMTFYALGFLIGGTLGWLVGQLLLALGLYSGDVGPAFLAGASGGTLGQMLEDRLS